MSGDGGCGGSRGCQSAVYCKLMSPLLLSVRSVGHPHSVPTPASLLPCHPGPANPLRSARHVPPTKLSGQGRSKTVPRQFSAKISETVKHRFSDAHHAQSSTPAQPAQSVCVWQLGSTGHPWELTTQSGHGVPSVGPMMSPSTQRSVERQ